MTAITVDPALADAPLVLAAERPVPPIRWSSLLRVELRKVVDTRSGRWLLAGMVGLCAFMIGWKITNPDKVVLSFDNYLSGVGMVVGHVTPILALLAMTSEWSQRTALTTFTLAPRRMPVLTAKAAAAMLLTLGIFVIGALFATGGLALGSMGEGPADWSGIPGHLGSIGLFVLLQVLMGLAFGALAGNTPAALGAFLMLPTAWAQVAPDLIGKASEWFDMARAYDILTSPDPLEGIGKTVTAIAVWVVVPLVLGTLRALRRDA